MTTATLTRRKALDLIALVKPRIMVMALLTAAGGVRLAGAAVSTTITSLEPGSSSNTVTVLWLLVGTALIVGAANTLNMYLERDVDCLMARTKDRPLPGGRLDARTALAFGAVQGALALPALAMVNVVTAALGLLALILYVGVYTPMKQRSHWSVWVGGVPGAMPALMGWTAATGRVELGGLAVFAVLFIWQVPHFHAIALYRQRDYDAAGLKTLPGTHGVAAARTQILAYLVIQVAASFAVVPLHIAGTAYLVTASVLGAIVLGQAFFTGRSGSPKWARDVFLVSIVYLPVLFAVMVI